MTIDRWLIHLVTVDVLCGGYSSFRANTSRARSSTEAATWLVATNPPSLGRSKREDHVRAHILNVLTRPWHEPLSRAGSIRIAFSTSWVPTQWRE